MAATNSMTKREAEEEVKQFLEGLLTERGPIEPVVTDETTPEERARGLIRIRGKFQASCPMTDESFKVGDLVRLRSDSPLMTVSCVTNGMASVIWWDREPGGRWALQPSTGEHPQGVLIRCSAPSADDPGPCALPR